MALRAFPAYYSYNRKLIPPYKASKPWIAHFAFQRLKSLIRPNMSVLEFGSGGSTLYLADKVESIYSIEHDPFWFKEIHKELEKYPSVTHVLVSPEKKEGVEQYKSVNGLFSTGLDFEKYAHAADHLPDNSIDLLIIDGRVRPQCLKQTKSKLKPGGILLFDNADRESYQETIKSELNGWKMEMYNGVTVYDAFFNETRIYYKPSHL
ncbi:class I SAM-dependent methyltransferase [Algoriphagus lacus]|uniref:Class I SAM-dependent methyltransferase n=1 Tax=Algoriphagus lacus TaxID=2056311 RepID=A0A418PLS3_9BACT|nr:class I SAM-dependent methyltransferase [Algoriphagus lacus]RIW12269.1 class I SAM-dependent methyltransferase [Algoriphagus lacus]